MTTTLTSITLNGRTECPVFYLGVLLRQLAVLRLEICDVSHCRWTRSRCDQRKPRRYKRGVLGGGRPGARGALTAHAGELRAGQLGAARSQVSLNVSASGRLVPLLWKTKLENIVAEGKKRLAVG